mmetsp:Transcript_34732/g.107439  ORF Transcript_34732/g.107439 Transcript_34732/m.107439 type:complete len:553 (-) Transcript_34732:1352-3010(-)
MDMDSGDEEAYNPSADPAAGQDDEDEAFDPAAAADEPSDGDEPMDDPDDDEFAIEGKKKKRAAKKKKPAAERTDDFEEEIEAIEFKQYAPKKVLELLKEARPHPDKVVENATLASVEAPDVDTELLKKCLKVKREVVVDGHLSALQLETVVYATLRHEKFLTTGARAGFALWDGAGMGKGRQLAGVIANNWRLGRKKHVWISCSADLIEDARRDLKDLKHAKIKVRDLKSWKGDKDVTLEEGVIFATYSLLVSGGKEKKHRLNQLVKWCGGESFQGCIMFDEAHKAKNLYPTAGKGGELPTKPTKTGLAVKDLQRRLPGARVVYASATAATEPHHVGYCSRLGLWKVEADEEMPDDPAKHKDEPFDTFLDFLQSVRGANVMAMMESVAMYLKSQGAVVSRSLSFQDCSFELVDGVMEASSEKCIDNAAELWAQLHKCINWLQARGELRTSFKGVNYGSDESDDDDATAPTRRRRRPNAAKRGDTGSCGCLSGFAGRCVAAARAAAAIVARASSEPSSNAAHSSSNWRRVSLSCSSSWRLTTRSSRAARCDLR